MTVNPLLFGSLGVWEIILIVLVVLLFFGGKKIPELMRGLGKGVKSFKTDLNTRTVTITFDADKTTVEKLQKDFKKFKYEAQPVECAEKTEKSCCNHKH